MSRFRTDTPVLTRRAVIGAAAAAAAAAAPSVAQATSIAYLDQDAVDAAAARVEADLIALRRDLHAHPEGSGEEARTAAVVAERLAAAGLTVATGVGGHGVVGVLKGRRPGRTVAFRADMDAVPGPAGAEHVCGHDLHTAVGVGAAQVLAGLRDRLHGTVVFVFQPAEESLAGAKAMLADGVLETYGFTEVHALHCGPFPVGAFAVNPGLGLPGLDRGTVAVGGPDAPGRAGALVEALEALSTVQRPADSAELEALLEQLQTEDGPLAEFVTLHARVADGATGDRATVEVSYRCWPEERYTGVRADVGAVAAPYGAVRFPADPFPALVCPEEEAHELKRHLRRALGPDSATVLHAVVPFNGEDFALFVDRVPGTFTWLGVRAPGADIATASPHFPLFEPDEAAIGHGVRAMAGWLARRTRC